MATISELNRSTEEQLDLAREKLKDINERLGSERNRDSHLQRRRPHEIKRTLSMNSNSNHSGRSRHEVSHDDVDDEDNAEEDGHPKVMSRVVSSNNSAITKREQVIAMQSRQNDLARNKRMFGCLLGTLQKFKKEENFLKSKEDKKAKIEKKLEEQEQLEKIKLKEEREALIANRRRKQLEVKVLETKMAKLRDLQAFEDSQKHLSNYIKTETKPSLFWLPKTMTPKTAQLQSDSSREIKEMIEERRKLVDKEIRELESKIDKDVENDHHTSIKLENNHTAADATADAIESEKNGREKNENSDRGLKRRASSSPEVKKRVCSQVVVKSKD